MADGNLVIDQFFSSNSNNNNNSDVDVDVDDAATRAYQDQNQKKKARSVGGAMSACLINLEDTRRLVEWIPYHSTMLPLINQCTHCSSIPTPPTGGID